MSPVVPIYLWLDSGGRRHSSSHLAALEKYAAAACISGSEQEWLFLDKGERFFNGRTE